ncbi:MAG: hypothetical protein M3040_04220 [Bacteroidota bacterium]|nr:hypothetical protein [Bacteroidota bacterium]
MESQDKLIDYELFKRSKPWNSFFGFGYRKVIDHPTMIGANFSTFCFRLNPIVSLTLTLY